MKKKTKKLVLAKETLQNLELQSAAGGFTIFPCGTVGCQSADFGVPCPEH